MLRPIEPGDRAAVLDLNERHVEVLAPLDAPRLDELLGEADLALVLDVGGTVAGFVLTFAAGCGYDGTNFRWFAERLGDGFCYLDRVVVDAPFRRRGLGALVYDAVEAHAAPTGRLALEVNVQPPNEPSLAFHRGRGFREVGRLPVTADQGTKQVVMLVKDLA